MKLHARTFARRLVGTSFCAALVAAPLLIASGTSHAAPRGGSRSPGRSGDSTSTNSTATKPSNSGGDIKLLEGALATSLTDAQKTAIAAAATTRESAFSAAETAYKTAVATTFGLTSAQLDAKIRAVRGGRNRDLATTLAAALGRALTDAEKSALAKAAVTLDAAATAANQAYRTSVAATVEMSLEALDAKIKSYLDAKKTTGKGKGGKGGKGENCEKDTTTGDTTTTDTSGTYS